MGLLDYVSNLGHEDSYNQVNGGATTEISHQLIAAAASYEAAKAYENHCAKNGKPDSHAKAKEIAAALAGGVIDRLVETKGVDFVKAQQAKHEAKKHLEEGLQREY